MKKIIVTLLCLAVISALVGCDSNSASGRTGDKSANVNDVLKSGMAAADSQSDDNEQNVYSTYPNDKNTHQSEVSASSDSDATDEIDVDLTTLSSTMVYSEVYNMMVSPKDYVGKTVKMNGSFSTYYDEITENYYFACIIKDATACCAQGIEFVLAGNYSYPNDYPEEDSEICVIGVFDTYKEGDCTYCTLRNAKLVNL